MADFTFYAHSGERADRTDWQTLQSHLEAVAELAARYAGFFGGSDLARLAGLLHDLGKYTHEFQQRLAGEFGRMDHATWGARLSAERYGLPGRLLAYAIAGHHAGIANGVNGETRTALHDRLNSAPKHLLLPAWQNELRLPAAAEIETPSGELAGGVE